MPEEDKVIPVKVALRCRPLINKEILEGCQSCIRFIPNEPQVVIGVDKAFTYDYVFSPEVSQQHVYDKSVSVLIDKLFKGYNVTVLAYGQTGSGKTYTMGTSSALESEENVGIIPRAVKDIFNTINKTTDAKCSVKISFLEIYKEEIFDLLNNNKDKDSITVRENFDGSIRIVGLTETIASSLEETMQLLETGTLTRTTAATAMNFNSSRSHAIFTITLEQCNNDTDDIIYAKFHFVDLAGSERAKKTGAQGERLKEGININRGLLALGNVISSLCNESSHIPYRDSKLTRLLQDSLGGNSHTIMIACVSPADFNLDETVNTLRYADRARKIKNKPIINIDSHGAEIAHLKQLVQQLQLQLLQANTANGIDCLEESSKKKNFRILLDQNKKLEEENRRLAKELQSALDQTTVLCEKALLAEMTKDKLLQRLEEIKDKIRMIINSLNEAFENNPELQEKLELIKELQDRIVNLQNVVQSLISLASTEPVLQMIINSLNEAFENNPELQEKLELIKELQDRIVNLQIEQTTKCDFSLFSPTNKEKQDMDTEKDDDDDDDKVEQEQNDDNAEENEYQLQSTLRQAAMNRELQELEHALALKEDLAFRMKENDSQMAVMRLQYEACLKELEEEVSKLQKEKELLSNQLKVVHTNNNTSKISEQRRKRLQELEVQISQLKKEMTEKARMLKMKEEADRKVKVLQQEIQEMKQARVRLLKQMKEEAEKFRQWKLEKDRELARLRQQDRKRQYELVKMEKIYTKQKNVLKRKMEEAVAANKKLQMAMQQQRAISERREREKDQTLQGMGNRIRQWLQQELDLVVSSKEADHHLQNLLEDRKSISEQLNNLKNQVQQMKQQKTNDDPDVINQQQQINQLQQDLHLRNAQIADLQQRILDVDQDEKAKHRWENMNTMVETKCALKWLFENAVAAKIDMFLSERKCKEFQNTLEDITKINEEQKEEIEKMKKKHQEELVSQAREHEDKTLYLLKQMQHSSNSNLTTSHSDVESSLIERIKFQESEITRLSYLYDELQQKSNECEALKKKLLVSKYKGSRTSLLPEVFPKESDAAKVSMNQVIKLNSPINGVRIHNTNECIPYQISEQRRKRLQELEVQISQLKKEMTEKARMLKMKEEADRKVKVLQQEIQEMKQARVRLLKQMKEEAEKFRQWKLEKDRELARLRQQDRKRQYELVKMEKIYTKQKNVLKRKMEEAVAANKKLQMAMQQQRAISERREREKDQTLQGMGNRIRQWLQQELDLVVSSKEADHHLQNLLEDRKSISEQLNNLKNQVQQMKQQKTNDDPDVINQQQQINQLQQDLHLRNAQIADLQQRILDVDQDEKAKHRWENMNTMVETKCALKWLFENAVAAKIDMFLSERKCKEFQNTLEDITKINEEQKEEIEKMKKKHQEELVSQAREHEDKTLYLLKQMQHSSNSNLTTSHSDVESSLIERIKFQESEITRLSYLYDELQQKSNECEALKKKLLVSKYKGSRTSLLPEVFPKESDAAKKKVENVIIESSEPESEHDENDDDPDWIRTPYFKRIQKKRKCNCNGKCRSKICGCRRNNQICTQNCKCDKENCTNRSESSSPVSQESGGETMLNTTFNVNSSGEQNAAQDKSSKSTKDTFVQPFQLSPTEENESKSILGNDENILETEGIVKKKRRKHNTTFFNPLF
ncbi:chromosome-associated kinesin KIF4-like [Centruroides sculpturatus]|uniref:chromosome-associated kinesin KIF4-like n=1 Tax=Centruroides sculpturatus TaxID=218467 RepID=UPI000C6D4B7C|nr:chromosome-associated kinesin KIF4-like [Centruroides sculpturatus]